MQPKQLPGFTYAQQVYDPAKYYALIQAKNKSDAEAKKAYEDAQKRTEKPKKGKGSGNQSYLSSLISELSGTGGALGGAATGAAIGSVVPGIGNIIGAIIGGAAGGFAGGTGGRLVENKVRDKEYRLGDSLKEGLISGAFGAGGEAFQAGRGLSALSKASGSGGGLRGISSGIKLLGDISAESGKDVAKLAGKTIVKSGARGGKAIGQGILDSSGIDQVTRKGLQSFGDTLRAAQRGTVAGNNGLSPAEAKAQSAALDNVNKWFSGIGKSKQIANADDAMKALSNEYKRAPEAAKAFGATNADELGNRFIQNLDNNPVLKGSLKGKNGQLVDNLLNDAIGFSKKKNGDFVEYMASKINPRYRTVSSGGSAGSVESQILEAFRDAGKSIIDDMMPTRSGVNKQFSDLLGATKQLGRAVTRDAGASQGSGLTLGRILSDVAGPTMDVAGRGAQQLGKVTKYTTPLTMGVAGRGIANQMPGMASGPAPRANPDDEALIKAYEQYSQGNQNPAAGDDLFQSAMVGPPGGMEAQDQSQYSLQQAMADIQRDPSNAADYMKYYDFMTKATTPDKESIKAQDAAYAGSQALSIIDELEQAFNQAGGAKGRVGGTLSTVAGKAGFNDAVNVYNDNKMAFLSNVARSLGERGVLTDADIERIANAFPSPSANPQEAASKWTMIRTILNNGIQNAQAKYGASSNLSSVIQQYQ